MIRYGLCLLLMLMFDSLPAQTPPPTLRDLRYGPHERNLLDLWQAPGDFPAPLVVYYHGGGFLNGDKSGVSAPLLNAMLGKGISFASVNYRYSSQSPFPAPMHDGARAVQFLRLHAGEYRLDPQRVGAFGGSAGGGISLWMAMHEDLADPASADPLLRQSTRVKCAAAVGAQTYYDPRYIMTLFNTTDVEPILLPLFGMQSAADVKESRFHVLFEEASPITHASAGDPPLLLIYEQSGKPLPPNSTGRDYLHHPKFGQALKEKLEPLGVACDVETPEDFAGVERPDILEPVMGFFHKHLVPPDQGNQ